MTGGAFLRRVHDRGVDVPPAAASIMRSIIKLNFPAVCINKRKDGCGKGEKKKQVGDSRSTKSMMPDSGIAASVREDLPLVLFHTT